MIFLKASKQIDLERKKCTLRDGQTRVPCVDVEVTMRYDGEGVPQSIGKFDRPICSVGIFMLLWLFLLNLKKSL